MKLRDDFGTKKDIQTPMGKVGVFQLERLEQRGFSLTRLPLSIRVLLEAALRQVDGLGILPEAVETIARWGRDTAGKLEIPFQPARVVMQDFTGVPAIVDLAALREAMRRLGGDPARVNPRVPVDLVIDHSVQVDSYGSTRSLEENARLEFARNRERYEFLKWGQRAFRGFKVVPPATGIVHQVNLEYLATVVVRRKVGGEWLAFPDSLVGTDSHTTMVNGLGVLGWGVGGIEAEAAMLGQPIYMLLPEVVGFRLSGALPAGVTATDLVLTVTERLRAHGVVGKFVEFYGPGLSSLSLPDRATLANMAPEYGATMGFFPVDAETLAYLRQTHRPEKQVQLVEKITRLQGLFRTDASPEPEFSDRLALDLGAVEPCLAGPKRPQDRVPLKEAGRRFSEALSAPVGPGGFGLTPAERARSAPLLLDGCSLELRHGQVVVAAITSCTNTSNPDVLLTAGLLARRAVERGLRTRPWVKTSLAPGSKVVTNYLESSGLMPYLQALGFHLVGYGCTTCIGNSGPLPERIRHAVREADLVVAAVLSGNRNFEGRICPETRANYLASPPLVVAYALAGRVDWDPTREPVGLDPDGRPVFLGELWPSPEEVRALTLAHVRARDFKVRYAEVYTGNPQWNEVPVPDGELYAWRADSTYIREAPFFDQLAPEPPGVRPIRAARVLAVFGDSVTTDHISPAGDIAADSPAGRHLKARGVDRADFNSYGSRRGNHEVMMRGTFANIRIKNLMLPGVEGGLALHLPSGERLSIWDAAERYRQEGVPLVVLAGKEYGSGSSRDWAAKGPRLQGVRAVVAESFERIHRSNLVGMGILPLAWPAGQGVSSHGLTGRELFEVLGLDDGLRPGQELALRVTSEDGRSRDLPVVCRIDTPVEVEYYRHGGILEYVLRKMLG
jgi:aconitate hydratase